MSWGQVIDRESMTAAFDAVEAALDGVAVLDCDASTAPEWLEWLERCERLRRRIPALEHGPINHLARQATPEEVGPPHLDRGQPRTNTFHHPEKLLHDEDDDDAA
jgi:hypothetical protein